jgi:SAM-dependent methyltransferase
MSQLDHFSFACPECQTPLVASGKSILLCPSEGVSYPEVDGIWRFLTGERQEYFHQFMQEYQAVRQAEGRSSLDPDYYRALPFEDLSGLRQYDWDIRATSYRTLLDRVIQPMEGIRGQPLKILDIGAGNAWLSYRLAQRGHHLAAIDLLTNAGDGLGAYLHYDACFLPVQADFNRLPFTLFQMDLVIYNASIHYATSYHSTLLEGLRVLGDHGCLVVMDTPVYSDPKSGVQMVLERESQFKQRYGFPSNAIPSENYLTYARLQELSAEFSVHWQLITPFYGFRWMLRPWLARLRGSREPARFSLITGSRQKSIL